jgi:CubicO group peptidase (beta-lactamase class C family)
MTKTFVGVGVLILVERGLLKLEDPVSRYIPAFKKLRVVRHGNAVQEVEPDAPNVAQKFTILRLLTHTAGVGYGGDFGEKATGGQDRMYKDLLAAVDTCALRSLEDFCDELSKLPLRYEPGQSLNYAMGHDILARIIEIVSKCSFDNFLKAEIFKPLGMSDTDFCVPHHKASRLAALYGNAARAAKTAAAQGMSVKRSNRAKGALLHRIDGHSPRESNWIQGRHCNILSGNGILGTNMGGLVSTLSDQAKFFTILLNGGVLGRHRILQASTVDKFCFQDLLPLPGATGKRRRTGQPWSGWSALGERGMKRTNRDPTPKSDEYEEGEIAMGGAANTMWSINPMRDTVTLFFTQALDSYPWQPDEQKSDGFFKVCPANFTVAARAIAPRDPAAAALRRQSLYESKK